MNIASLCSHDIVTLDEQDSLRDAATLMREHHVGALVVTANDGQAPRAVGILTDRDLAIEGLLRADGGAGARAGDLASRRLSSVAADADIGDAVAAMRRDGVRRLLVTGADGEVTGIVSMDDLLGAIAVELGTLAGALRAGVARESERKPAATPARTPVFLARGTPGWRS